MDLSHLPVRRGFRMRGQQATRLETFVDAAFAFAVTLLVVSFGAMPDTFAELYDALRRLPAFLGGFAVLALFWHAHYMFSRRYGLEDGAVVLLGMALVAAALFYVFPLRMVMSAAMHFFTGGWAPRELEVTSAAEFRAVFVLYGVGFATLAVVIAALYAAANARPLLALYLSTVAVRRIGQPPCRPNQVIGQKLHMQHISVFLQGPIAVVALKEERDPVRLHPCR